MLNDCDALAVTETFLTKSVLDSELTSNGWSVLRRDRGSGAGGGVMLVIRPGIKVTRCCEFETTNGEDLWARCVTDCTSFYICVVYIHPRASDEVYMNWFLKVESFMDSLKGRVIIVGDLNLNPVYTSSSILSYYCYFLTVSGLSERNEVKNAYGGQLDVVLVSDGIDQVEVIELDGGGLVPKRDAYHPPLEVVFSLINELNCYNAEKADPSNIDVSRDWNFSKGNYKHMYQLIAEAPWKGVFEACDVDTAVDCFYDVLYSIFDECVPKKKRSRKPSRRYPVWFTLDLINDIKYKSELHRQWKSSRNQIVYNLFSEIRTMIKQKMSTAYDEYINRIQWKINREPKAFWQHVNSFKIRGGFETRVAYGGKECVGSEAAQAFSSFFSSVFLPDAPVLDHENQNSPQNKTANMVHIDEMTMSDVETGINKLKPNSAIGPDNIPAYIIKGCKESMKFPILHIFNMSLKTGIYPKRWKVSRVQPIPKSNDHSQVENYRPIAILSSLPKLFEFILHKYISRQIQPHLCDSQHGFRFNRSVSTNLLTVVDIISQHLDKNIQVDIIYFDFKKAFDRVDNDILLGKLNNIGFSPKLLKFFSNYLRDRQQYVRYGCFVSPPYHTRSGVSQGSVLGPLLFGLMVNDLESCLKHARCLLYADDLKLIYGVKNLTDTHTLQSDIDALYQWSKVNKLHFNTTKCNVMTFSRVHNPLHVEYLLGSELINRVYTVKDLGVIFDPRLNFHEHMRLLTTDSYRRLGFVIRNMREFDNPKAIKLVYMALVRSKLETASIVWNPHESTYALLLEKVQKAFLRFLYKKLFGYYPFLYPTKFLLGMLNFNSLEVRRNYSLIISACSTLRGQSDCPELVAQVVRLFVPAVLKHQLRPRKHPLLAVPAARTVAHANSPLVRALTMINALLTSAPECDLFAARWKDVCRECLV